METGRLLHRFIDVEKGAPALRHLTPDTVTSVEGHGDAMNLLCGMTSSTLQLRLFIV